MEEQNIETYIEKYLSGQLSSTDKKIFEDRLHDDKAFKKQYEDQLIANKIIEIDYAKSLSKLVYKERTVRTRKKYVKLGVIALVSTLAIVGWFVVNSTQVETNNLQNVPDTGTTKISTGETTISNEKKIVIEDQKQSEAIEESDDEKIVKAPVSKITTKVEVEEISTAVNEKDEAVLPKEKPRDSVHSVTTLSVKDTEKPVNTFSTTKETVQNNQVELPQEDCSKLNNIKVKVVNADLRESNGELVLDNQPDVTYRINDYDSFESINRFSNLETGSYNVAVRLGNCQQRLGVFTVKEKPCLAEKSMVFNPAYDRELIIPTPETKVTYVTIFDGNGSLVFEEKQYNSNEYVWSGALSNGNIADIGSYILRLKGDENYSCEYFVVVAK